MSACHTPKPLSRTRRDRLLDQPERVLHAAAGFVSVLLIGLTLAGSARAQSPGLYLTWNDCLGGSQTSSSMTSICGATPPDQRLVAAFVLASPVDSVIAVEVVVDVQFGATVVPKWWQFEPSGCRFDRLRPGSLPPPIPTTCANLWNQDLSAGLLVQAGLPRGGANQTHIVATLALPDTKAARTLSAGTMYFATVFDLLGDTPPACTGCATSACLVLNSILLGRVPGSLGGDVVLGTPGPGNANQVSWQGGSNCSAVPVRGSTWGRLKGLYR